MGTPMPSVYHQVIEATKGQSFRTSVLLENIDKRGQPGGRPQVVCVAITRIMCTLCVCVCVCPSPSSVLFLHIPPL